VTDRFQCVLCGSPVGKSVGGTKLPHCPQHGRHVHRLLHAAHKIRERGAVEPEVALAFACWPSRAVVEALTATTTPRTITTDTSTYVAVDEDDDRQLRMVLA
jgi:hypothetical protein